MSISSYTKKVIKFAGFNILSNPLRINNRLKKIKAKRYLTILNLHRVDNNDKSAYPPLNPKIFESLIQFLLKNYEFTSFLELEKDKFDKKKLPSKPKVILSFDDGYKDFINIAHPILLKYGIRSNQNIIPSCIDKQRPPFNVILQDFLGKANIDELEELKIPNFKFNKSNNIVKEGARLSSFVKNNTFQKQLEIEKYCLDRLGDDLYKYSTEMMNKSDIKEIMKFHDIGVHSFFHSNMSCETDEFFKNDIDLCSKWFEHNFCEKPYIYAFPNASYKKSNLKIAKEKGYTQILLVNNNFSNNNNSVHNRFAFHAYSEQEMIYRSLGFLRNI
ncbi:polysaccharide deacetylase family protein [Prochlorococcus marinus XMU1412]|uniref:polysaccharide deacetylase family protein n=1 Tax=Prochlorococcus marinus TaxID=1219 RepID=UPI001ADC9265|nr:polysaccharide deacetylase family protein [Prochlorococcus marinus]MBO8240320.1 polysaccharide deacetylase family protein [Prochlorococcus marinus XMU1412]